MDKVVPEGHIIKGKVSTIIPVHNRPFLLQEAVTSVLAQSYRPIEIIIVDDGSIDETAAVASKLAEDNPDEISFIQISNSGPGIAREAGRQLARGEFIQYLDSDDILLSEKFEMQVKGLQEHPECGVSYGMTRYYHIDEKPNDTPLKRTGEKIEKMFPAFLKSRWWSTHTPLFRREVTDKAGPWTSLRNEEDWEYDCRVAALGVKLHYCNTFLSETRDHNSDRLCSDGASNPQKLHDRAVAHELIYGHATSAGISIDSTEMKYFARECFLLCRQCGVAGLSDDAKMLFRLSREASSSKHRKSLQFKLYAIGANLIGWRSMGRLTGSLDRLRL